jgi:hypothetical protein
VGVPRSLSLLITSLRGGGHYKIEDVEPHFEDNTTHSLVRDLFLIFCLGLLALGVEALHLGGLSLACVWGFYHWKVLQLGFDKLFMNL